jgi:putative MATE family efflux protein
VPAVLARRDPGTREIDRQIVGLAVPAFLSLIAEPAFLLADAAIVGHLGTPELAGLGIASVVLRLVVGLCIFLAYATTAAVARQIGAGNRAAALTQGIDGLWLAAAIGVAATACGLPLTGPLIGLFGPSSEVGEAASAYLRVAWLGLLPMLLILAATGVLRGLSDTRTPLYVAVAANIANIVLNVLLVYGLDLGIAGSALGTDLAQLGGAVALVAVVVRTARKEGASLRPDLPGVRRSARAGGPLLLRTVSLQVALVTATWCAAGLGATATATHQVAMSVWTFLAHALDAVAIAAQTITGSALGAGDIQTTRAMTDRMIRIGIYSGVVTGVVLALTAPVLGPLFTDDPAVVSLLGKVLLVAAAFQPAAGVAFVLDGVLIGAGDGRYLAIGSTIVTAAFVPLALLAVTLSPTAGAGLVWLWVALGAGFIGGRAVILVHRARGTQWMITGEAA